MEIHHEKKGTSISSLAVTQINLFLDLTSCVQSGDRAVCSGQGSFRLVAFFLLHILV